MATSLLPQQGSSTQAQETNALDAAMDILKPQISNIAFAKQGYILPANIFRTMGMLRPMAGEISYHFEIGNAHPNFQTSTTQTPAQGADITITVAVASTFQGNVYPRATDTVRFKNKIAGKILSKTVNGNTYNLVIRPYDLTTTLSTTNGDYLWILGNSQAEGSFAPAPRVTEKVQIGFPLQTIREAFQPTGVALTNEWWITRDQMGQARSTYSSGVFDTEMRYWEQWGNVLLLNPLNLNPAITESYSYSLEYLASGSGFQYPYTTGVYGLTDFNVLINYYNQNKGAAGNKHLMLAGPQWNMAANTGLQDIYAQNPIIMSGSGTSNWVDKFTVDPTTGVDYGKNQSVEINFRMVNTNNMTFYIAQAEQLGLNTTGGATGFTESGYSFQIPLTKGVNAASDVKERMLINYKRYDQWDRMLSVKQLDRNAPIATSSQDVLTVDYLGEFGLETFGLEGFTINTPQ